MRTISSTFGKILDGDAIELLDFLKNECFLVNLDHNGGASSAFLATGESELSQRVFDRLHANISVVYRSEAKSSTWGISTMWLDMMMDEGKLDDTLRLM